MRLHSYWTERVLARPPALARIGAVAVLANERLDGSGYHRGLSGAAIPASGRILAVADACRAMSEPRPHRPALSLKQAADELRTEVRSGRLAADAVDAVLAAAGQHRARRRAGPAGLTPARSRSLPSSPAARPPGRSPAPWASRPRRRRPTSSASTPTPAHRPARPPRCSRCSMACWTASARSICRENPDDTRRRHP
jgi:HD domain